MRRLIHFLPVAVVLFSLSAEAAKTPQQLKDDFASILPTGKKARIAFSRGNWSGGTSSIYVIDSDDGIMRELTPSSIFSGTASRKLEHACITADGKRVIFWDATSRKVYVVNWEGNGLKEVYTCSYFSRYWRNPADGSDWFTAEDGGVCRINVDNTSQKVLLWNKTNYGRPWYSLSADGTHMVFNCPHPQVGIATVPNGTLTKLSFEGCFVNISPDNTYRVMPQNGSGSGYTDHTVYIICNADGSRNQVIQVSDPIITELQKIGKWKGGEKEYEDTRWAEPDYTTFFMYQASVNPFIFCLSTKKWMWINDGGSYGQDGFDVDMRLMTKGGTSTIHPPAPGAMNPSANTTESGAYLLDGRRVNADRNRSAGAIGKKVSVQKRRSGSAQMNIE